MGDMRPKLVATGLARLLGPGGAGAGISARERRAVVRYEIAYTLVDLGATLCFVFGSVMFFAEAWETAGIWMYLIGSLLFAVKPALRLLRDLALVGAGREDEVSAGSSRRR